MSDLRITDLTMPTAELGPSNPLPPLFPALDSHEVLDAGEADEEMRRNIGYGRVRTVLPYLTQDGYGRERTERAHRVAVLENETLRAFFLLDVGGRLWSLVHKPTGRELLFRNPVFQPANLALRDAWVAGGVEWNFGTIGHATTSSSPVHAARARRPDGTPVLRMYEFERVRRAVLQIDAYLPDGSQALLVHVTLVNPNDHEIPVYWWSNIAVPERPDTRVLAPADRAWQFAYDKAVRRVPIPRHAGLDRTYTTRADAAADYFFDLDPAQRRWITALDGDGTGLAQTSTRRLVGRKLFLWGRHRGGRRWQEWLSTPDTPYLEIQAGLARTQLEHLPMPARTSWTWLEAYGHATADPAAVHGDDWPEARAAARAAVDRLVAEDDLERELADARTWTAAPPEAALHRGTGWGALERRLRALGGDASLERAATPFPDDTLGPEQEPWLALLRDGRLPDADPDSYQTDPAWEPLLRRAGGWLADLHLGVLRAARDDPDGARAAWTDSLNSRPTSWAWRNLGALAAHREQWPQAVDAYLHARELAPDSLPLLRETVTVLLAAGRPELALRHLDARQAGDCGDSGGDDGRLRMLEARAALAVGDRERCDALLDGGIEVANLREGETSLSDLWRQHRADVPVPRHYDFVMQPGDA
ncbi:DUF5107 domain-containing protein [Kitasatospora sp. NPDC048365]|uniref:DUF5107 domain-containing protein n=1 Tax=Kitasatospora sp. NPDC048365 TaxID=3364050 RepID=UPI003712F62B